MRYQPAEKTYVTSYWKGHQGFIAIIGSLVVLSVFMLIVGATAAQAQTGQDPRCDGFTRQPFGLCVAAVSEGCFDSVESDACDDLTTNWTTHCRDVAEPRRGRPRARRAPQDAAGPTATSSRTRKTPGALIRHRPTPPDSCSPTMTPSTRRPSASSRLASLARRDFQSGSRTRTTCWVICPRSG
jgi:hypothetical protein